MQLAGLEELPDGVQILGFRRLRRMDIPKTPADRRVKHFGVLERGAERP
jgi:hypothetical protein